jgi:methylenetetrahydrofolate--tRNA-(uracil-5-)-methyltransferase
MPVTIIGGGLAGCEAAWQIARRGAPVRLYEMKPGRFSPAHKSPHLAELVCSNSLRSNDIENAVGLLKEEMRRLDSLIIEAGDATAVPAGSALAVDRTAFSLMIEERLAGQKEIEIIRAEITQIPSGGIVVIATGPLTSDSFVQAIGALTQKESLAFYDAIAPIIESESIDRKKVFAASRYGRGADDYLNCPMNRDEYEAFWKALIEAKEVPLREFEEKRFFEGCLPIEVIAKRGIETLAHGPMKPVGLIDPQTGKQPYAVVQLRREDRNGILYNIVGFQTKMTWPEQGRVLRMIPGLEHAEFARYGSIHRNTFIDAPRLLLPTLQFARDPRIFFAGQITGVEGYVESTAMGLLAGIHISKLLAGEKIIPPPPETALGALTGHLTDTEKVFQPMNVTFGLFSPLAQRISKKAKKEKGALYAGRALAALSAWKENLKLP